MRIYIVSAYPTVRAGLRTLVREHAGWTVVGESGPALPRPEGADATAPNARQGEADSVAVDVLLADVDAAAGADQLSTLIQVIQPRAGVVAIGAVNAVPDNSDIPDTPNAPSSPLPSALANTLGALSLGILPRDATAEEIVSAVDAVAHGLFVMDRGAARRLLAAASAQASAPVAVGEAPLPSEALTAREREVLQLLAEGLPNKLIAARLHVSEHTAKFHVASIMTKLGAASRTEAVTLAARRGLLIL